MNHSLLWAPSLWFMLTGMLGCSSQVETREHPRPMTMIQPNDDAPVVTIGDGACARMPDSSVQCWGHAAVQLGVLPQGSPLGLPPIGVAALGKVAGIALGGFHGCVVSVDGTATCWGGAYVPGATGTGTEDLDIPPTKVMTLSGAVEIAAGAYHSCARLKDGAVECWGSNKNGELGVGAASQMSFLAPQPVPGIVHAVAIASRGRHNCALEEDKTVRCWGSNSFGELGDGTTTPRPSPTPVAGLSDVEALALGGSHACVLRSDGAVLCWGNTRFGQAGKGDSELQLSPSVVLTSAIAVASGQSHTCAVLTDGSVQCWGEGTYGQLGSAPEGTCSLGDSQVGCTITPQDVKGLPMPAFDVAAGESGSCARLIDGSVSCWGSLVHAVSGPPNVEELSTPVPIEW